MIAAAKQALAAHSSVALVESTFEKWAPEPHAFGLVAAAQAWHWVDPGIAFKKAHQVLRENGWLVLFGHVPVNQPEALHSAFANIRKRHVPESPYSLAGATAAYLPNGYFKALFDASELFGPVMHKGYAWTWRYTTASFIDNQRTISEFQMMAPDLRERFLADIGAAIDAHGGAFDVDFETHLYMAKRKPL